MQNHKLITILSIIIGFTGVIVPISWDFFTSRALLQVQVLSNIQIVNNLEQFNKVEVTYDGEKYESISKIEFLLINIGNTPITSDLTKVSPYITLSNGVKALQVEITRTEPESIYSSIRINKDSLVIDSPLLNPNDRIFFTALVAGSDVDFKVGGRIAGIKSVELWDRTAEEINPRELPQAFFWSLIGGCFVILLFVQALKEINGAGGVILSWQNNSSMRQSDLKKKLESSYKSLYNRNKAKQKIKPLLENIESSEDVSKSIVEEVSVIINSTANQAKNANIRLAFIAIPFLLLLLFYGANTIIKVYG